MPSILNKFLEKDNAFSSKLVQFYNAIGKVVDDFGFPSLEVSKMEKLPFVKDTFHLTRIRNSRFTIREFLLKQLVTGFPNKSVVILYANEFGV